MHHRRATDLLVLSLALLGITSCGGGTTVAGGGTGGTGMVARGPVSLSATATGVAGAVATSGGITVNRVTWNTKGAAIHLPGDTSPNGSEDTDGDLASRSLAEGMIVTVRGKVDASRTNGQAEDISYGRSLYGRMSGVTSGTTLEFYVYGQHVTTDTSTIFIDQKGNKVVGNQTPYPNWVRDDNFAEVSGYLLDDGHGTWTVQAAFVRQFVWDTNAEEKIEVEGEITNVDTPNRQIVVGGGTTFSVSKEVFDVESLSAGNFVKVEADEPGSGVTTLIATDVEIEDLSLGGQDGDEAELTGVVSELDTSRHYFYLSGQKVCYDTSIFPDPNAGGNDNQDEPQFTQADLVNGARIEVEGVIRGDCLKAGEIDSP